MNLMGVKKREVVLFSAVLFLSFLLLFLISGCAAQQGVSYDSADGMEMARGSVPASAPAPEPAPMEPMADRAYQEVKGEAYGNEFTSSSGSVVERHIIQNAHLNLEVLDIDEASAALQQLTDQANGYIASREIYNVGEERRAGNISLRVPAEHFNFLVGEIKELGKVKNDRVYTDDVTMQYIDLEARIANMTAQEKRLRELLEKAENIEEIMQVERELGRVRGDLEAMTGNFRYLRERVQFSAIDIRLDEKDVRTMVVGDKFEGFGERVAALLSLNTNRFLTTTTNFFVVAIGSLPIVLPLLIIGLAIFKGRAALSRAKNRKREEQQRQDLSQDQ